MRFQNELERLEYLCNVANARTLVAENLAPAVAFGWATAAHLKWGSWILSIIVFAAAFWFTSAGYSKESDKAQRAYDSKAADY